MLEVSLPKQGVSVEREKPVSFEFEGTMIRNAYYIDLLVEGEIIVEVKAVETLHPSAPGNCSRIWS